MSSETETETKPASMEDMIAGTDLGDDADDVAAPAAMEADDIEDGADDGGEPEKPEPKAKAEPEPERTVPLSVLQREREELKARADYWQRVAEGAAAPKPQPQQPDSLDFLAEPERIGSYIDQKVTNAAQNLSRRYADRAHGKEVVDTAYAALRDHGTEAEKAALAASDDPWGDVVTWNKRRQVISEIGDDPDGWRKRETERLRKELLAEAAVNQAKGKVPSVPSMAAEPNLGARNGRDDWTGPTPLSALLD